MDRNQAAYWLGVAFGVVLGLGSFVAGCSWDTCLKPSLTGTYPTQLQTP